MNNLHFTETSKGLNYRLKRCEYTLNALKFSTWHQTFYKSVTVCNVLYLCGLTCIPDDIFFQQEGDALESTCFSSHHINTTGFQRKQRPKLTCGKYHLKSLIIYTQRCTHFWRFILKSTPTKTLSPVRTLQSSQRHTITVATCQSL